MSRASLRTGMMTAIVTGQERDRLGQRHVFMWCGRMENQAARLGSVNMKYMTTTMVVQKTTCLCQNSTSP